MTRGCVLVRSACGCVCAACCVLAARPPPHYTNTRCTHAAAHRITQAAVLDVRAKEAGILRALIWWQALFVMLLFSGPVAMAVVVFAV